MKGRERRGCRDATQTPAMRISQRFVVLSQAGSYHRLFAVVISCVWTAFFVDARHHVSIICRHSNSCSLRYYRCYRRYLKGESVYDPVAWSD